MTFNKNDIDTIEKAKEYPDYHGGELTQPEKDIFNDDRLITDKALLQNTAELLNNCKKAEANLVTERTSETGLSTNGNELLISLMEPRRNNSLAYQLINTKEDGEGKIDKMVKEYQTVLFRKNNKTLDLKLKEALITFSKVSEEEEKVAKEITELEKKYNPQVLQEQTDLEDKVDAAVTALKDDLRIVNTGGRKFLEFIIENGKKFSELNYKSDVPATTEHYGSIIKTGYNGNNKPYTHPLYLNCAWDAGDKKKFKGADASIIGKKYVDNSTNVLKAPFDVEEKHLTWANAIEFNAYDEVISKDGIMDERIREEEITIYEKKLTCSSSIFNRHIAKKNYTFQKIAKKAMDTLVKFREEAKDLSFNELKVRSDKLTNFSDTNIITYQETIAIRTLIYFLTDLEKEGKLETPLTATEKGYLTKVEQLETLFKKDELELKKIADILLNLEDKTTFFNELKEYFKDKQGVPTFPVDTTDDYQKTDYFFTLSPHYVIGFSATYQIKHDSAKKKEMEDQMTMAKNEQKLGLDLTKYGNGTEFTEAGIIKYYAEELGGVNHHFAQQGKETSVPKPDF
ncbi:9678_t:CDS:2 [Entrophospora sp. SA101]|nr:9678_t:CDS:2 [Entrophospora sp. SA101]